MKHSFITKFNRMHADVYSNFRHIISYDLLRSRRRIRVRSHTPSRRPLSPHTPGPLVVVTALAPQMSLDPTHNVVRRIGLASLPFTCLVCTPCLHCIPTKTQTSLLCVCMCAADASLDHHQDQCRTLVA